ncbi:hypothetical protein LQV63_04365 [Paenibacillus profundus]|uniref:Uncharacterized protein n=1 Tax=Paenibacillus profundus TaxID=1173085 RepID=A0ABS8YDU5_9BACL|nr:hypothetical protein [Paenibacillus profundus]MCE5168546.1 hypothetical protein [Paenibacillus profundus]
MGVDKTKKPVYKRWWFIVIAAFFILAVIGAALDDGEKPKVSKETPAVAPVDDGTKEEKMEEKNNEILVTLDVKENVEAGKVGFEGTTNLPSGTELMLSLTNDSGYNAQAKTAVNSGEFKTEQFSNKGEALETGTYSVNITMPIASVQPEDVQKVIGADLENLKGDLVKDDDFGKVVKYSKSIEIEGAEKIDHSALIKSFKEQISAYYNDINNEYDKHKKSLDLATWGEFARGFKEGTTELRNEIDQSALSQIEQIQLSPACGDLQILLTSYAASLQGRGDDEDIKRLKKQIEEAIK